MAEDNPLVLFLDTNVLLHYRYDELDWLILEKTEAVRLTIAPVVFRELNKQKDSNAVGKLRERARKVLVALDRRLKDSAVARLRDRVDIEGLAVEPNIDFESRYLDRSIGDDVLIASVLSFQEKHPDRPCKLVTRDIGLRLKAKYHSIDVVNPPGEFEITEEESPAEKRIRELQAELSAVRSRLPNLRLKFVGVEEDFLRATILNGEPFDSDSAEKEIERLRLKHPPLPMPNFGPTGPMTAPQSWFQITVEDREEYNRSLEQYFEHYRRYQREVHASRNRAKLVVPIGLEVVNNGTSPARTIVVALHFPDGFKLTERLEQEPAAPRLPEKPRSQGAIIAERMQSPSFVLPRASLSVPQRSISNVSAPTIRKGNSYDVEYTLMTINHGFGEKLEALFVAFESFETAKSFKFTFRIHSSDIPVPEQGVLSVAINEPKKGGPTRPGQPVTC